MRYLTFNDVQTIIGGRSRSSIYRDVERGYLPKPIRFGRRLYWDEAQVLQKLQDFSPEKVQMEAAHEDRRQESKIATASRL